MFPEPPVVRRLPTASVCVCLCGLAPSVERHVRLTGAVRQRQARCGDVDDGCACVAV
jgi:hypothetical protein